MAVTWFFTVGCARLRSRHIALLRLPCNPTYRLAHAV
jgi:hypothetical protein